MSQSLPRVLTRRHFAGLSMGLGLAGLAGCGGGGFDPVGDGALAVKDAPSINGPGLIAQAPLMLAGPGFAPLQLKSVDDLADGGFAVAWTRADASLPDGPWQVLVQRFDRAGEPLAPPVPLAVAPPDAESAVSVLPDGTAAVAWRREVHTNPGPFTEVIDRSLLHQRFDTSGQPLGDADVVTAVSFGIRSPNSLDLRHPHIDRWPDGSHVVAWAKVLHSRALPGTFVTLEARRYHASGWPAGNAVGVGASGDGPDFTLQAWERQGGYVVGFIPEPFAPQSQAIRAVDFWNPIDPARLQGLAQGSFLVDLGVCGTVLVAGHRDTSGQAVTWERQLFNWEGQAVGPPVPLPQRPAGIVPLRTQQQLGQFLLLSDAANPFVLQAQRMDKWGNLYGDPFEVPRGSAVVTGEGQLVIASLMVSKTGNYSVVAQRFTDPLGPGQLPA